MDHRKKADTIRRELKDINYLNRLYSRLRPAEDPDGVCRLIQGAEVIAAEVTANRPGRKIEEAAGMIIYLRTEAGKYMALSLSAVPGSIEPTAMNIMTADIITR